MKVPHQLNFSTIPVLDAYPEWARTILARINTELQRVAGILRGPVLQALGNSGSSVTIKPYLADLTTLTLTANVAITLDIATRAGAEGLLEVVQDGTGGRTISWTNATGTGGSITAPTSTASKRSLYAMTFNGSNWVVRQLASNYD